MHWTRNLDKLAKGESITFPYKGNTMGPIIPYDHWVVISPITDPKKIKVGDIVLSRLPGEGVQLLLVKSTITRQGKYYLGPFLKQNSNVWVGLKDILGRRTKEGEGLDIPLGKL